MCSSMANVILKKGEMAQISIRYAIILFYCNNFFLTCPKTKRRIWSIFHNHIFFSFEVFGLSLVSKCLQGLASQAVPSPENRKNGFSYNPHWSQLRSPLVPITILIGPNYSPYWPQLQSPLVPITILISPNCVSYASKVLPTHTMLATHH